MNYWYNAITFPSRATHFPYVLEGYAIFSFNEFCCCLINYSDYCISISIFVAQLDRTRWYRASAGTGCFAFVSRSHKIHYYAGTRHRTNEKENFVYVNDRNGDEGFAWIRDLAPTQNEDLFETKKLYYYEFHFSLVGNLRTSIMKIYQMNIKKKLCVL